MRFNKIKIDVNKMSNNRFVEKSDAKKKTNANIKCNEMRSDLIKLKEMSIK